MIILDDIIIEGFGSIIRKTKFDLNQRGLNVMRGKIGSGKTSIPSSLFWCVYGKTLKKGSTVETWPERRGREYRGTMVKLNFKADDEEYTIIRCINFNGTIFKKIRGNSKLLIIHNGKNITAKGKVKAQKQIIDIIGYSPELFVNSIIYGQRLKRIIEESGPNKKKLFDEAFETIFIEKAKVKADSEKSKIKEETSKLQTQHEYLLDSINNNSLAYTALLKNENSFEANKKRMMKEYEANMQAIKLKMKRVRKDLEKIPVIEFTDDSRVRVVLETHQNKLIQLAELHKTAKKWEYEVEILRENKHNTKGSKCFECGSIINEKQHKKMVNGIQDKIEALTKNIEANKNLAKKFDIEKINSDIKQAEKRYKEYETNMSNLKSNNRLKDTLERQLSGYKKDLSDNLTKYKKESETSLKIESKAYKEKVTRQTKEAREIKKQLAPLQEELERLDWAIKDPLSNSGIKAYVFDNLLWQVNQRLYEYGEILKFRVEFGIDLETKSKDFYQMIYKDDVMINYPDLSGGQKQLVDTAVALALHSVISGVRPINILFLDEPFEALDAESIELVTDIIMYKLGRKSLYLITHHSSFKPNMANNIYFTQDENGNTQIS